ncbi:hypothetical protein [Falsibacillus pallidus]|uniref:hypothetical protein n=1 Tax=Falsibacillus pallidus TaxID=493781 RepID=UPI003D978CE5
MRLISVGCHFDFAREEELAEADYVIKNFEELKELLPTIVERIGFKNRGRAE